MRVIEWLADCHLVWCLLQIVIDHDRRQLRLIDWGLAEFYFPGKEYVICSTLGKHCVSQFIHVHSR